MYKVTVLKIDQYLNRSFYILSFLSCKHPPFGTTTYDFFSCKHPPLGKKCLPFGTTTFDLVLLL